MKPKSKSNDNVLERVPDGGRIAIIRLRSLGDCVLTTPAIELLKRFRPDLRVAVVAEPCWAPIFAGNPYIETVLPPSPSALFRFRPVLTINVHGGPRSAWLTLASGACSRAGFGHFRFQAAYNLRIPRAQEILGVDRKVHTAEHLGSAMFFLGVPPSEIGPARLYLVSSGGPRPAPNYAVIHPKASAPGKTWPAERFLQLAKHLQWEFGLYPVFIAGPGESLAEFGDFECLAGADLEQIKSLLAGAALFVGNDSGPAHMAAAFGVPSVVLFGASDVEIWRPWRTEARVLQSPEGIGAISIAEAAEACSQLHAVRA